MQHDDILNVSKMSNNNSNMNSYRNIVEAKMNGSGAFSNYVEEF